ncbi:MAG: co-chaperone DjlA [Rhodocyclaceae bacterium]|jgi:DnaJ like chaperone protein|nr:co-chaperone DjlA [Rhodocyclaceae bacterium]
MFKLIGSIAGFYFLGFLGGLLGFVVGWVIDRMRDYGSGGINPLGNALRQAVFLETLFIAMGRLAKADGRVSEAEIAHAEALMRNLGMTEAHRAQAIALFKRGVDPATDLAQTCSRFMSVCGHTRSLREILLVYLITFALADEQLHSAEEALLAEMASCLGYDQAAFRRLVDMVLNQSHFAGGSANKAAALDDAYKALGVTKESSDQEVKRAYRKLISQYHPDKLIGQGLPDDMIAMATEKAKEIQVAYDLIEKSRAA